jgi:mRNA-degrading endonuclease YafQ of YafQ-DinJ toxin-antitoxin module
MAMDVDDLLKALRQRGFEAPSIVEAIREIKGSPDNTIPKLRTYKMFKESLKASGISRDFQVEVLSLILEVMKDPFAGQRKTGSLKGIRSLELKTIRNGRFVYSYIQESNTIHLLYVGSHAGIGSKYELLHSRLSGKLRYFNREGK